MVITLDADVNEFTNCEDILIDNDRGPRHCFTSTNEPTHFPLHLVSRVKDWARTLHAIDMDVTAHCEALFIFHPSLIERHLSSVGIFISLALIAWFIALRSSNRLDDCCELVADL